ncbi:copia protein [Tanacetum coccineum]
MCDKKNNVLFTDTACVVLSPDFKLSDENHVLLKVLRKDNMYSVDLKNVVPQGGLTCLFAKATPNESNLWHRRPGHNKARLVAQGYTQEEGIYYDEVFAPVSRIEAIRLFLAYASFKDFVVYQMDVNGAFLYGKTEEEVYFLATAKVKTINGEDQLQALVDGKKVIITETSVRRDLHLEDAKGTECLPTATIFEELIRMGGSKKVFSWEDTLYFNYQFKLIKKWGEGSAKPTDPNTHAIILNPTITSQPKKKQPRRKQKKNTKVPQPSSSTNDVPDENVPTTSNDLLLSGEDRLKLTELIDLCTNLQKKVLDLWRKAKTAQE